MLELLLTPVLLVILIYGGAAILPAAILLRYVYKKDKIEPEPGYLLRSLLLGGVLSALASILLETISGAILDMSIDINDPMYFIYLAFLVVACAEEGTKMFFLKRKSWNDPNFNYMFDGIVYAVFVSLGFAAFENVMYVVTEGLSVAIPRAIFSIPGHMSFAVYMGVYYAEAKFCELQGRQGACKWNLVKAFLISVFLHGFYDACAMIDSDFSTLLFLVFVILMFILTFRKIRVSSKKDRPIQ